MNKLIAYWKYDVRMWWFRHREDLARQCAQHAPRWLCYWIVINEACKVSLINPNQEVPTITWDQMAKNLERK